MKRIGHLFEAVCEPDNLRLAFWKASRGKRCRDDQRAYAANLGAELAALRAGLLDGTYPVGDYTRFTIHEPKERIICAAAFRERVLHHALMNVCEPYFDKWLVFDSYACRVGKGQLRAVRRAQAFARRYRWFLKCDFRKFFDSVPHDGLQCMLERKFKDGRLIDWFLKIIATYETSPGRGLPIGNLTSQHLANLYLDPLDRRCGGAYARYMDDFVLWSDDKDALKALRTEITAFAADRLSLTLKGEPCINRTDFGMDFLGLRVFPGKICLNRRSRDRFKTKSRRYDWMLANGYGSEADYQERMTALTAFTQEADATAWRRSFFTERTFWESAISVGVEPCAPRRELEQQRQQLPFGVSQQQQPVQQEQQQRLPPRSRRSTAKPRKENLRSPPIPGSPQGDEERSAA